MALIMAAIAYTLISIGFVLQKKGISWIGWKGEKDKKYFRNFLLWISGFIIMNIYGIPSAIALKTLPPHMVSAFAGWGIIVLVFLSKFFLKEQIFKSDYFYSGIVISGIVLMNLTENISPDIDISTGVLTFVFFLFPLVLFIIVMFLDHKNISGNILFAAVSGCSAGLMIVSLKGLVHLFGYRVIEYFGSEFFYLYIFFAILSLVSLQMSFKAGPVMITGQIQYSTTIIYPVAGSLIVFSGTTGIFQLLSLLLITAGVIKILKNR